MILIMRYYRDWQEEDLVVTGPFRLLSKTLKEGDLLEYEEPKKDEENAN